MKPFYHKYIIVLIIAMIGFLFHFKTLNEFPQYKHCWAQCDRYALSLGFINNGGNLFLPETYLLNKQFPDNFKKTQNTSITSVDFPVHDYIVSLIMRIFATTQPWCFRLYLLLYSLIGLFFLFRIVKLFTNSIAKAICIIMFAASSPVFVYYQAGFLPTIPSLANAIIGLFFLFKYTNYGKRKDFALALFFLTLATLARLPFAIMLVAMISLEVLNALKSKKNYTFKFWLFISSISIIAAYYFYNNYLRNIYGSIFLNYLMPPSSFDDFIEFIGLIYERWAFKYFSGLHYIFLFIGGIIFLFCLLFKKIKISEIEKKFIGYTLILFCGCLIYFLLMEVQYLNHDYYFLDTFYLPVVFLFTFFIIMFPHIKNKMLRIFFKICSLIVFIPVFINTNNIQFEERNLDWFKQNKTTAEGFKNADVFLDSLQIPKNAKILVMGEDGPNNPLILMRRKGFTILYPDYEIIDEVLNWPYDYVVLEHSKIDKTIYPAYPKLYDKLLKIADNSYISIFIKKNNADPR